jgi:DNA-directed RNA polymerase subunit RPC12/RpoP
MHDDCNDCGESIEICGEDGIIQPDAEISCPNCGAIHVVQVEDSPHHDPQDEYVYLTLTKHGAEVIDDLRKRVQDLLDVAREYGEHDTGCPGWYRAVRSEHDPAPPVKCINDPCDCGYDAALEEKP